MADSATGVELHVDDICGCGEAWNIRDLESAWVMMAATRTTQGGPASRLPSHGRAAFGAEQGESAAASKDGCDGIRYLQGAYIDWDDVLSKIRVCRNTDTRVGHSD